MHACMHTHIHLLHTYVRNVRKQHKYIALALGCRGWWFFPWSDMKTQCSEVHTTEYPTWICSEGAAAAAFRVCSAMMLAFANKTHGKESKLQWVLPCLTIERYRTLYLRPVVMLDPRVWPCLDRCLHRLLFNEPTAGDQYHLDRKVRATAGILAIRNPHHAGIASSAHCNSAESNVFWKPSTSRHQHRFNIVSCVLLETWVLRPWG